MRAVDDTLSAVGPAAAWLDAIAVQATLRDELRNDMQVCVEEALANLIMHARPRDGAKGIEIAVESTAQQALITIKDRCEPFDVTNDADFNPSDPLDENRIGGNGIKLMRALTSELRYAAGAEGNTLSMRFGAPASDDLARIRAIAAFAHTPDKALTELLQAATRAAYGEGERMLVQDEPSTFALILLSGEAAVVNESTHGETPVARIAAPALVGEIGALAQAKRTASVRALTAVEALKIDREALLRAARHDPDMLVSVIGQLGQQIHNINAALGLYAAGLTALEQDDLDSTILSDLKNPSEELRNFASAFERLAQRVTHERRTRAEMASAALIQRAMLPSPLEPALLRGRCTLHADMKSAREVGGDLFDLTMLDEHRVVLAVGDVCGKGAPASLFMASTVMAFRIAAQRETTLATLVQQANDALCAQNAMSMFTTLFYAILDLDRGELAYVNCGHNPPLFLETSGATRELPGSGPPLGFFPGQVWSTHTATLAKGDGVFLFTDGVTECLSPTGEDYGEARLAAALEARREASADHLVRDVIADCARFAAGAEQSDDITCLALRWLG